MHFKAGKLTVFFDNGSLRYIKFGGLEVLNRIYFAVRDANWETVKNVVENVETQIDDGSFQLKFDCLCQENDIDFRWKCEVRGQQDQLIFDIKGKAHSDFKKNRVGFCVLHPLNCKDRKITITHTGGSQSDSRFPNYISPHQPFMDIEAMHWNIGPLECQIDFEGDIFETEDQRNWSDASFKTYCTPLELPFPVSMQKDDEVHQTIKLGITETPGREVVSEAEQYALEITGPTSTIPSVGLEANEELLDTWSVEQLKSLNLSHLRIEARTHEKGWQDGFEKRLQQAKQLGLPIELVIFLKEEYHRTLATLKELLDKETVIKSILPIDTNNKSTSEEFIQSVIGEIKALFAGIPIGGGTDCFFTEFNRFRPPFQLIDFVSFSTNPQAHAFDDLSLIETLQTLPDMLESAGYLAKELPVHVSPVTLKQRFNPNATTVMEESNGMPSRLDHRHNTSFNALWTMGCLKHFAQSGAGTVTFFQTAGEEGTLMPDRPSAFMQYAAAAHEIFPVFELFKTLGEFKGGRVIHTTSSQPMAFEGMLLEKDVRKSILLANFTENELSVTLNKEVYTIKPKKMTRFNL